MFFFFEGYGDHRELHVLTHSFPTRRSSDLVWLPFDYVDVSVADPSVAHLDAEGRITALDRGTSYVTARRGDVAAATVVPVGPPANYIEFTTSPSGIDAYPDALTILPSGQERRIVTRLDPTDTFHADGPEAGTVYLSANPH